MTRTQSGIASIALVILSALAPAQDWKLAYRTATGIDIFQTHYLKGHGFREGHPDLRGGTVETAARMVIGCEAAIYAVERFPKSWRPFLGYAALYLRIQPVLSNARAGFQPRAEIPLIALKFRS